MLQCLPNDAVAVVYCDAVYSRAQELHFAFVNFSCCAFGKTSHLFSFHFDAGHLNMGFFSNFNMVVLCNYQSTNGTKSITPAISELRCASIVHFHALRKLGCGLMSFKFDAD